MSSILVQRLIRGGRTQQQCCQRIILNNQTSSRSVSSVLQVSSVLSSSSSSSSSSLSNQLLNNHGFNNDPSASITSSYNRSDRAYNYYDYQRRTFAAATSSTTNNKPSNDDVEEEEEDPLYAGLPSDDGVTHTDNDTNVTTTTTTTQDRNNGTIKKQKKIKLNQASALAMRIEKELKYKNCLEDLPDGSYTVKDAYEMIYEKKIIQQQNKDDKEPILSKEFLMLCDATQAGNKNDAYIIRNALKVYKNNKPRSFILEKNDANYVIDSLLKALLPAEKASGPEKIYAALYILELFLDTSSGLYYSTRTWCIDNVLEILLEGIKETSNLPIINEPSSDNDEEDDNDDNDDEDDDNDEDMLIRNQLPDDYVIWPETTTIQPHDLYEMKKRWIRKRFKRLYITPGPDPKGGMKNLYPITHGNTDTEDFLFNDVNLQSSWDNDDDNEEKKIQVSNYIINYTKKIIELLSIRCSKPYLKLHPKKRKLYFKQIRCNHGPTQRTCMLGSQILLNLTSNEKEIQLYVLNPCIQVFNRGHGPIDDNTIQYINNFLKEKEEKEKQAAAAEAAAAAAAAEEEASNEDEKDEEKEEDVKEEKDK